MGCVSVTISYSICCLTTETVKYINENSFIENLAASKYTVCGTERQTNAIINNIGYVHFACSEEVSCPVLQKCLCQKMFVSIDCSVQRKRSNENLDFLFSCV